MGFRETTNFNDVALGETIIYYKGQLATDRIPEKWLDRIAEEVYNRSTAYNINRNSVIKNDLNPGTGEFELKQYLFAREPVPIYIYTATRIKEIE